MKVYTQALGKIDLTKGNFLASGGEAAIYVKDNFAFKIYSDPAKMIPAGKIQELSEITDENIIKPKEIIFDTSNKPIGFTMRFVKDTYALCQAFTRTFREREGLDNDKMRELVKKLRQLVEHVHDKNILIVDLNELNFLVSKSFDEIYGIDADSYKTKNYPATALMESI